MFFYVIYVHLFDIVFFFMHYASVNRMGNLILGTKRTLRLRA